MADIQDFLAAERETNDALWSLNAYAGTIEEGRPGDTALALCLAARSITLAIREASVRFDYVVREEARRAISQF